MDRIASLTSGYCFILWVGTSMPGFEVIDPQTGLPELDEAGRLPVFFEVKHLAFGAVAASMIAYLLALIM